MKPHRAHSAARIIEALLAHPTKGSAARSLGYYDCHALAKRLNALGYVARRVDGVWIFSRSPTLAERTLRADRDKKRALARSRRRLSEIA